MPQETRCDGLRGHRAFEERDTCHAQHPEEDDPYCDHRHAVPRNVLLQAVKRLSFGTLSMSRDLDENTKA